MPQQNFMNNISFRLVIDRLPQTEFFVQSVDLPGINLNERMQPNPFKPIPLHGDTLEYDTLNVTMKAEETLDSFKDLKDWMTGLTYPDNFDQFKNLSQGEDGLYADITLMITSNAQNPLMNVKFYDAFPQSISGIQINVGQADVNPPTYDAVFKYSKYEFIDP